ncbi:glycosyltransferase [Litorisediminicola beolgyonensis]|uniref:Glycosyltransferase n=1 Tax=Litorisediminicola beolgyonensis TaxID=1173614 RepID=A0ABW3ZFA6_9RHOB
MTATSPSRNDFLQPSSRPAGSISILDRPLELSVIVPTFNEAANVDPLIEALSAALRGRVFEVIFVDDDSGDGTADRVRERASVDPRIRCLHRSGRRGLSSACIEGIMASAAPCVAVIDGDLQHDETLLPKMLDLLDTTDADIVVGSRYVDGGGVGNWTADRVKKSQFAGALAKRLTGVELSDPMSGFFMVRSETFRRAVPHLSAVGFKILLDLFTSSPETLRFRELPYTFRSRERGESKLDNKVLLEFLELLIEKSIGRWIPAKFIMFALVGGSGVVVHFLVLSLLLGAWGVAFSSAHVVATCVAMTWNYAINNVFTHHDKQLRGAQWLRGWLTFALASSIGAITNVGVATYLFEQQGTVWYASALAGIAMGVVWNYAITSVYTWRR